MTCTRLEVFEETSRRKRNVSGAAYGVDLPMGMPFERTHGNIELAAAQDERGKNAHAQAVLDHSHNRIIIPAYQRKQQPVQNYSGSTVAGRQQRLVSSGYPYLRNLREVG